MIKKKKRWEIQADRQKSPAVRFRAVRALTSLLIFLAGVKWSCLRIDKPVFSPMDEADGTRPAFRLQVQNSGRSETMQSSGRSETLNHVPCSLHLQS